MSDTTFNNGTVISSPWLNDVNSAIYKGKLNTVDNTATATDVGSFQLRRNVEYAGGSFGFVNSALRVDTFVDNAAAAAFEWAGTFVMHNNASAGENVAVYAQGIKNNIGPTWGAVIEVIDNQAASNPTTGVVGLEVDVNGNGTDTNLARVGIDIALRRPPLNQIATPAHFAYGLRIQNSSDTQVICDTGIGFYPGMVFGIGIDLAGASITGPALNLNTNQSINFNGNAGVPANVRKLFHNGSGLILNNSVSTNYWAFNDSGSLVALGTQLLGARQTGYVAMTGITNRSTVYDPSTITLVQLAQRVNALQADLTSHGLIGT